MATTEAWKKASELREKALKSRKQSDLDAALAAQCAAERDDAARAASVANSPMNIDARLARMGKEIDQVEKELQVIEGAPIPGAWPATGSPQAKARRKGRRTMGKKNLTTETGEKKPRAKGIELLRKRLGSVLTTLDRLSKTKMATLSDEQFDAQTKCLAEAFAKAQAAMRASREAPKPKEEHQLALPY